MSERCLEDTAETAVQHWYQNIFHLQQKMQSYNEGQITDIKNGYWNPEFSINFSTPSRSNFTEPLRTSCSH